MSDEIYVLTNKHRLPSVSAINAFIATRFSEFCLHTTLSLASVEGFIPCSLGALETGFEFSCTDLNTGEVDGIADITPADLAVHDTLCMFSFRRIDELKSAQLVSLAIAILSDGRIVDQQAGHAAILDNMDTVYVQTLEQIRQESEAATKVARIRQEFESPEVVKAYFAELLSSLKRHGLSSAGIKWDTLSLSDKQGNVISCREWEYISGDGRQIEGVENCAEKPIESIQVDKSSLIVKFAEGSSLVCKRFSENFAVKHPVKIWSAEQKVTFAIDWRGIWVQL